MKKCLLFSILTCCCGFVNAQSELDKYVTGPNTFTIVGNASNSLTSPHDLDFVPERPNEWWVLNKEASGGSIVIFYDAGKTTQNIQLRRDSHNSHFMVNSVAISMGDNGTFCSAQEIKNTSSPTSTFMGPALWYSDTSIFARVNQNNWVSGQPLGSHLDMLHQSPYGMGVAHDNGNAYWYFDGHNGNICKYQFSTPHVTGGDDHSDGKIYRYSSVMVSRIPNLPSHLTLDKQNKWLYIVDGGTKRIIRLNTMSGTVGSSLSAPSTANEPLAEYKQMNGPITEVMVSSGLTAPCGIDYRSGRIIVSDNSDGKIYIYNVNNSPAVLVGSINTGTAGIMGVRIDDNNKIWYVNQATKQLIRIDNPNILAVSQVSEDINYEIYPNPASEILNISVKNRGSANIKIYNLLGKEVYSTVAQNELVIIKTSNWTRGLYTLSIKTSNSNCNRKILIN